VHEQETAAKWKGKDIDYVMDYFVNILNWSIDFMDIVWMDTLYLDCRLPL
jgi:hypothetical protein